MKKQGAYLELIPSKGQYRPGEDIVISVRLYGGLEPLSFEWSVYEWHRCVRQGKGELDVKQNGHPDGYAQTEIRLTALGAGKGAFGIFAEGLSRSGGTLRAETAFDIAEHWREAPRYGFLSDFAEEETAEDVDFLNRHHINMVQFYDWMYRHDELLPTAQQEKFVDPLDRRISLKVVRDKIERLRERGMASMAYAAVYASLSDYMAKHPEQGLYMNDGNPYSLGNYFFIMDISEDSDWTRHMLSEYGKVLQFGFDGLHLDQYGFPKKAIRKTKNRHQVVYLKDLYPSFINSTRQILDANQPETGVMFNNVSDYPTHTTAHADLDAVYIELWEPMKRLGHLKQVIHRARELSGKHVVLAAYLPAFHPEHSRVPIREAEIGATVAMAAIFANGGYHLLLGENEKLLADSYFPKYGSFSSAFKPVLQRYYDFIVMYRDLLYDLQLEDVSMAFSGGINTEVVFSCDHIVFTPNEELDTVWTIIKEKPGLMTVHCINLHGLDNDIWHAEKKNEPIELSHIEIKVEALEQIEGIYWASPDNESIAPLRLEYTWVSKGEFSGQSVCFTLPRLKYWSMVYIHMKAGVPT